MNVRATNLINAATFETKIAGPINEVGLTSREVALLMIRC